MVLSVAQPCEVSGRIVGVVGVDLSLSEIVENITYFNTHGNSYAFFINREGMLVLPQRFQFHPHKLLPLKSCTLIIGYTLMHPSLSRPTVAYEQPMATDIKYLENKPGFDEVREEILQKSSGNRDLRVSLSSMGKSADASVGFCLSFNFR